MWKGMSLELGELKAGNIESALDSLRLESVTADENDSQVEE